MAQDMSTTKGAAERKASFAVRGAADPQLLPRLLNFFAQRWLVPNQVRAIRSGDRMAVRIDVLGLGDGDAEIVAERLRSTVLVEDVSLRWQRHRIEGQR